MKNKDSRVHVARSSPRGYWFLPGFLYIGVHTEPVDIFFIQEKGSTQESYEIGMRHNMQLSLSKLRTEQSMTLNPWFRL